VLFLVPFLDRPREGSKPRRTWTYLTYGALVYILVLTYLGYTAPPTL
jgi:quinol-cytochrome oxidoreductase complex cytochrome b subunit